jgi:hypothetical protein
VLVGVLVGACGARSRMVGEGFTFTVGGLSREIIHEGGVRVSKGSQRVS